MKLTAKETRELFGVKTAGLPEEQKQFIDSMVDGWVDAINKSNEDLLSETQFKERLEALGKEMAKKNLEILKPLQEENANLINQIKEMGKTIENLQKKGVSLETVNKFDEKLNEMFDSEKYEDFVAGRTRKSGRFDGFSLKDTVSMTDNYEGTHLIRQQSNRVVSPISNKPLHMREVMTVLQGDPEHTGITYTQVSWMDRNARYVTENGKLPESSIKAKEMSTDVRRLGTHIRISKRMLKARVYLRSYILTMLPEAVYMAEDWNILFGDGVGENLLGIVNHSGVQAIEDIINDTIIEGKAGEVVSVKPYNDGADAIVEFKTAYPLMLDGFKITFAGASDTKLNATFDVIKINDSQILLLGAGISAEEAAPSNMTFKVNNGAFKSVDSPNSEDVIDTAFAVMAFAQYYPNVIVLNPATVNAIKREKDAIGRPLNLITQENGIKYIAGRPIVEYAGIPAGKYFLGDFTQGSNLVDYTSMSLEWAEDVDTKLANEVVLIAQEEVIMPVYQPWTYAYGDIAKLRQVITAPVRTSTTIEGEVTATTKP